MITDLQQEEAQVDLDAEYQRCIEPYLTVVPQISDYRTQANKSEPAARDARST